MSSAPATPEALAAAFRPMSPARQEFEAVAHALAPYDIRNLACLDIGLANPCAGRALRGLGGYWCSVTRDEGAAATAAEILQEEVVPLGPDGELPFDDHQFDVVVLADGLFTGEPEADLATLQEAHRVMRSAGILVASVPHRRAWGLANLFVRESAYTDKQVFELFKHGFDMLEGRTYCRFWTRLATARHGSGLAAPARFLDRFVWTPGYRKIFAGRRKLWRERPTPVLRDGRSLSEAVLFPGGI